MSFDAAANAMDVTQDNEEWSEELIDASSGFLESAQL